MLQTLDLLQNLCERRNYKFLRLDGNTSAASRTEAVDRFNARGSDFCKFTENKQYKEKFN